MKKFLSIFAVAALALFAVSCDEDEQDDSVELKGIELNQSSLSLSVGEEATLTVAYKPENATEKPSVAWTSSDASVASVSEGKVTALAAGSATITATAGKFKAECAVTVTPNDEPVIPVEGNSEWSVVGTLLESDWGNGRDYVCAQEGKVYVLKNVKLTATDEFKFRKDKDWPDNRGGNFVALGEPFAVTNGGPNIVVGSANVYDLYYNAATEEACVVIQNGTPTWTDVPEPQGIINIDGDFSDWAGFEGVSNGAYGMFKVAVDDNYFYIYSHRTQEGRYADIWGGSGYVYVAMDLDGNAETGETLWGNGPYDFVGVLYPYDGSAAAPAFKANPGDVCLPETATLANAICAGVADAEGAKIEVRIPRADLPALPEKFTVYSWGNKDLPHVEVKYPYEKPEDPDTWDYTPGAEYLADTNVWKAVDPANVGWFYNPNWAGELAGPETSFKESTYTFKFAESDDADEWTSQMWLRPANNLLLDTTKKYTFTCKVFSSTGTNIFIKMYEDGVNWPESFETPAYPNRISIAAGETKEIVVEDFIPLTTPQMLLLDFAHHAADNTIHVKDITIKVTGEAATPVEWDYNPGEEYLADNNLWKKLAAGNEMYYYYHCTGGDWNGSDTIAAEVPFMTVNQSTYELYYEANTAEMWMNQFFIFPSEGHFIPLAADKTYKLKMTVGSDMRTPGFLCWKTYNPEHPKKEGSVIWEYGSYTMDPASPTVIESPEITGVEAENIIFIMDFGGNAAGAHVYIKDITLVEVVQDNSLSVSDILNLEKGTVCTTKESLCVAKTTKGIVISDGSKAVYVYGNQVAEVNVGDKVVISASKTVYNGVHELEKVTEVEIKSTGNSVVYPLAKDITAEAATFEATEAVFVSISGTLNISGNYYNLALEGLEDKMGSIVYPIESLGAADYNEKAIKVTGYYNGLSGGGKYINVIAVKIEEPSQGGSGSDVPDYDPINGFNW